MKLSETFDTLQNSGLQFPTVPDYISDNLAFELRDYQKQAISRFLHYDSPNYTPTDPQTNLPIQKQPHLLWQMATGSGKTLIMAALILEMYKQGYRNFWFTVNSTDIINKTIDNFCNSGSKKCQFAPHIEIDGKRVEIKQVSSLVNTSQNQINIYFSTINILHQLSQPELFGENKVSFDDFKENPVVILADESHHFNASTKAEKDEESSWENSIQSLLKTNSKNRLFEFSATANLLNNEIANKYNDKLLFNYDLKKFRQDKYSKDVFTNQIDIELTDLKDIMLRSILISQYRKSIASDNQISLKPVILFKSKGNKDNQKPTEASKQAFDSFNEMIENLNNETIKSVLKTSADNSDNSIWCKTCKYFKNKDIANLVNELKLDFDYQTKRVLIHDRSNKQIAEQGALLTNLEETNNPVRAIFAVNMLSEGWDVLNLFDIVRLYDERDAKNNKPGKTTISEAQLIGRGARYFPFIYQNEDKYKRKFDDNEAETLRVLEQMHYHCKSNSSYISELHQALKESGIMAEEDLLEYTLTMKDSVKQKFNDLNVFENAKYPKADLLTGSIPTVETEINEQQIEMIPDYESGVDNIIEIKLTSRTSRESGVFTSQNDEINQNTNTQEAAQISETLGKIISVNIIRAALNYNQNFNFDKLKKAYPELESITQFIELLGKQKVKISHYHELTNDNLLTITKQVLTKVEPQVKTEQKREIVTKRFSPAKNKDRFEEKITRKVAKQGEVGIPQNTEGKDYQLDLSLKNWFVYDENYGTDQEKYFVKWFDAFYDSHLKESDWTDIYLARNDKAVKLYSWLSNNIGEGFEPDFVLFMKKGDIEYCFYIEPKGEHLFEHDGWKEDFLADLETVANSRQTTDQNNENYRVIGLPFFNNGQQKKQAFEEAFNGKIENN